MTRLTAALLGATDASGGATRVTVRFEWANLPHGAAAFGALILGAAALFLVLTLYRRERARAGGRWRWVCFALRLFCLGTLAAVLLKPSLANDVEHVRAGRLLVLADRSASMSVRDENLPEDQARAWAEALGLPGAQHVAGLSRHDIVRAVLTRRDAALLRESSRANQVQLLTFAGGVRPVLKLSRQTAGQAAPDITEIPQWDATGSTTDLAAALRQALDLPGPVAGLVLLTDGRATAGGDVEAAAAEAADRSVPLHFIGIGSAVAPQNVAVTELSAGARTLKDLPMRMRAHVRSHGYAGRPARLVLKATDVESGIEREILSRSIVLRGEGRRQEVDLDHPSNRAGAFRYTAEIEPFPDEQRTEDNAATAEVTVAETKIKVLIIAGGPSREYRFLKELIRRDPSLDLAVHVHGGVGEGQAPFPASRDVLLTYEVVVLADPHVESVSAEWVRLLAESVDADGLGLAFLAGPSYTPEILNDPALERLRDVLPVVPDRARGRELIGGAGYFTESWPVRLTPAGRRHPIVNTVVGNDSDGLWDRSAGVFWAYPVQKAKRGATVLLRHESPAVREESGQGMALVAVQPYGLGRVFYCGTPETWRWRRAGIGLHRRFWLQALRYCAGGGAGGARRRLRIMLERPAYDLGDSVRIRARLLDARFRPIARDAVDLEVEPEAGGPTTVRMQAVQGENGFYEGVFHPGAFGRHAIRYTAPDGLSVSEGFEVSRPDVEFDDIRMDRRTMEKLAAATGGRFVEPGDLDALPGAVPDRSRTTVQPGPLKPVWDTAYLLAALVVALAAEWVLRKRMGML